MNPETDLLSQDAAARLLEKSEAWLERARWAGNGPPFIKIGRTVRYSRSDIVSWLQGCRRQHTRDTGTAT